MIVEYIRYSIPQPDQKTFVDAYRDATHELLGSKHCLRYEVSQCHEDSTSFIVRIEWDSIEGHLEGFRKDASFRSFFGKVRPFLDHIQEMRHYTVTDVVVASREGAR